MDRYDYDYHSLGSQFCVGDGIGMDTLCRSDFCGDGNGDGSQPSSYSNGGDGMGVGDGLPNGEGQGWKRPRTSLYLHDMSEFAVWATIRSLSVR